MISGITVMILDIHVRYSCFCTVDLTVLLFNFTESSLSSQYVRRKNNVLSS